MDLAKVYGTNKKLEVEGVWVELDPASSVLIARLGNKNYRETVKDLTGPYRLQIQNGTLPDHLNEKIAIEALATDVLLDWNGIEVNGKSVPYSKEKAIELLTDMPDFREVIARMASNIELFQQKIEAAVAKN